MEEGRSLSFAISLLTALESASSSEHEVLQLDRIVHQKAFISFVLHLNCRSVRLIKCISGSGQKEKRNM